MNRLVYASGPWQIILAVSAIRQATERLDVLPKDYLVLWAKSISDETKQTMIRIASLVWNWQKIIWIDNLLGTDRPVFNNVNFPQLRQAFKKQISVEKFGEIWLCVLAGTTEKFIIESYLEATIIIYEDGLCHYVPGTKSRFLDDRLRSVPVFLKHQLKCLLLNQTGSLYSLNIEGNFKKDFKRLKKAYFFLSRTLPVLNNFHQVPIEQINKNQILATIDIVNHANHFNELALVAKQKNNLVIVLGQYFSKSKMKLISWEEELALYKKILSKIASQNLTPLWKEHPRADRPFFKALAEESFAVPLVELNVHFSWPIEIFTRQLNIVGCVSATSSSLFYQKELFNIPTYTFANELSFNRYSQEFVTLVKLVESQIPPLNSIVSN